MPEGHRLWVAFFPVHTFRRDASKTMIRGTFANLQPMMDVNRRPLRQKSRFIESIIIGRRGPGPVDNATYSLFRSRMS
jgi:hypothetical protein